MRPNRSASPLSPVLLLLAGLAAAPAVAQDPAPSATPPPAAPAASATADPEARRIAEQVMEALGGREAWEATRFLRFTFAGRRTHTWDKHTGRHRLEGETREGEKYVVLQDLDTREGRAWLNGQEASGDKQKELLENAYGAWINDTYWLLMPYKLLDPGVQLSHAGEETIDGRTYDKLHLRFQNVGLTPGDQYWAYVNRDTHLMDRWAYHLQDMKPEDPPTAWQWQGWQRHGNIMLAPLRVQAGASDRKLELANIAVSDALPDALFTDPAAPPAP